MQRVTGWDIVSLAWMPWRLGRVAVGCDDARALGVGAAAWLVHLTVQCGGLGVAISEPYRGVAELRSAWLGALPWGVGWAVVVGVVPALVAVGGARGAVGDRRDAWVPRVFVLSAVPVLVPSALAMVVGSLGDVLYPPVPYGRWPDVAGVLWMALVVAWPVLVAVGLVTGARHAKRAALWRRGHCLACGYDRRTLVEDAACPECGAAAARGDGW